MGMVCDESHKQLHGRARSQRGPCAGLVPGPQCLLQLFEKTRWTHGHSPIHERLRGRPGHLLSERLMS